MRALAITLAVALALLQYRLWLSGDGVREVLRLKAAVVTQQQENERLAERNRQLAAEVHDLKQGYAAIEERARADLGMIAGNETYYQVVPSTSAASDVSATPAIPATPPALSSDAARQPAHAAAPLAAAALGH